MQCGYTFLLICALFISVLGAPSVFQRNGLQREQESVLTREPFEPQSPFQLPNQNTKYDQPGVGEVLVVPTATSDETLDKTDDLSYARNLQNHFETLNKDAFVGSLLKNHIPFYVKTVVDPNQQVRTKIHVMRIPKKYETTSPLPSLDTNMVELWSMNSTEITDPDEFKIVDQKTTGALLKNRQKRCDSNSCPLPRIPQVSEKSQNEEQMQQDAPDMPVAPVTPVYEHAIIYKPQKDNNTKSIWDHFEAGFNRAKETTIDLAVKAKEKTGDLYEKAKEKSGDLYEKAKEKAKDALDSDETHSKEKMSKPEDDI